MTENNKSLFKLPESSPQEDIPVVISGGELIKDDSDNIKARLTLNNRSGKEISSVRILLCPLDKEGREIDFDTECDRSGIFGEGTHALQDIMLPFMTASFRAEVMKAVYSDGSIWEKRATSNLSAATNKTDDTDQAESNNITPVTDRPELSDAGSTAHSSADNMTVKNTPDTSAAVQEKGSSNPVDTASAEGERLQQEMSSGRSEVKSFFKKLIVVLSPTVLILSGLAIIFVGVYLPERRYSKAVELFNSGRFEEAIPALQEMNGYKDSAAYINTAESALAYQAAVEAYENGEYDTAYKAFTDLKDFGNSAEWAERLRTEISSIAYNEADALLKRGKLLEAANAFYRIKDYSDSWARCFDVWGRITDRKTISAGSHTVCLTKDGRLLCAGSNDNGELDLSKWSNIVAVSAGNGFTVGLTSEGTVAAVGSNEYEQCETSDWQEIVSVYAGYWSTAGVKADGTVVIAGRECDVSGWSDVKSVSTSIFHTVGLLTDGTVVAAETKDISGSTHDYGQFDISSWKNITAIATGVSFTVGLKKDGSVVAAGDNTYGQCDVEEWEDIVAISANGWHVVGLKADGTVVAAGWNENGECDVEDWEDIVSVYTGTSHTLGLRSDGTLVAVGNNKDGRCEVEGWEDIRLK